MRAVVFILITNTALFAATPREEVLNLVPPKASVCFVVSNLREQATTVGGSQFAAWANTKLAGKLSGNSNVEQLKQLEGFLKPFLGISLAELRDDILGDCLAFAYEEGDKPDSERGILILHARDPAKLKTFISKLNAFQKSTSDLKEVKELTHNGVTYSKRDRGNAVSEYYVINGNLFAIAMHEAEITALIDRMKAPAVASAVLKDLDALKLQDAFLACWLAPRSLDAQLAAPRADKDEAAGVAQMAKIWSAVDRCALYLRVNDGLELGGSVTYRADAMPAEVRPHFANVPQASVLWNVVPKDAIAAVAVTAESNAVLDLVSSFLPAAERPKLRKQLERELGGAVGPANVNPLLKSLGPDFGAWVEKASQPFPLVTAVVRVNEPIALLKKALSVYVPMFVIDYNRKNSEPLTLTEGDISVITGEGLPTGVAPAYGFKNGFFIVGSHTTAITKFETPTESLLAGDVPLARISGVALRAQIVKYRDGLVKLFAPNGEEAKTGKDLDSLAEILEAFDQVDAVIRGDGGSRTFAVKVKLVKPLK